MSKTDKIIEGNTLIANFMGWVHHNDVEFDMIEMSRLKYHESWDKLMPVVEKIEALGATTILATHSNTGCGGYQDKYSFKIGWKKSAKRKSYYYRQFGSSKILTIYQAAIQFITFYNNQHGR